MSNSNWVAIVSVVATSLATGYSTYSNNKSNTDLENTKQEHLLSVEKLKQDNLIALERVKSDQEKDIFLRTRTLEVRTQYCNEAKSLYKELGDAVITSKDRNIEIQANASRLTSKLKIQALAYLDDGIYDNYIKQSKNSDGSENSAIVAALATQVRRCAAMKPSDA
ncbi:hypothetical protein HRH33_13160 [Pseudomonas rhodesiae]|uniref:hypothetical protein n=1 Tax=Pseudomonas TaxID=286 RepID=UPI00156B997F|nr:MULTISPECIES: hypothetical protein [Pseudomonas]QKJ73487.1 hypothetical protein HRH33_13160 [Pseudomonas rhodesiae]